VAVREVDGPPLPLRLIALLAVAHLSFAGARLALTLQAVHLQASPVVVGLLLSLIMVVPMFVAVPIGRWADRVGFFRPALMGFALLVAAGVVAALLHSLAALGVASVLVGSGYMLAHVSINNAIGQASTPQTRASAFGAMALGFSASGLLGPMLAGFAIDYGSHAIAFGVLALFPAVSALMLVLPRRLAGGRRQDAAARESRDVMDLLRHAPLRAVFIVSGMISMGWDLFTFLAPLHGVRIGLSASAIGLVVGAFGAGSFAVRLAIPWLVRVFDEWRVLCVTLALTAACYVAFPFCERFATLLPLSFVLGMVLGCGQPLGMSLVHLTAPPSRSGEAVGVRSTITSISQTVLPLLFGGLGSAVGMVPVFWAAAAVLASGSAYAGRARPKK
jgi:MFS family permease